MTDLRLNTLQNWLKALEARWQLDLDSHCCRPRLMPAFDAIFELCQKTLILGL